MADKPDTIVLIHGFWVTPRSWEDWKARYEAKATGPHARVSRVRGRGRGAERRPHADRGAHGPRGHRAPRVRYRRARRAADPDGSLGRRGVHPAADGSWLRRGGCGDQLGAHRGRQGGAALADQVDVPGAQEPCQPPQGGGVHLRAVALCVHEHVRRGGVAAICTSATTSRLPATSSGAACSRTSTPATTTRTSTTTTPIGRRSCSSRGARTTSCPRRSNARTPSTTRPKARSPR